MALLILTALLWQPGEIAKAAGLQITSTVLPNATVGQPYSYQLQVSGGTGPYTWTTLSTTYPSVCCVLGINSAGLFGTQSNANVVNPAGTYSWTVQVTDANGNTGSGVVTLTIDNVNTISNLTISPSILPSATIGQPYSATLQVSGGAAPYVLTTLSTTYPSQCCVLGVSGNTSPSQSGSFVFNTQSNSIVTGAPGTYTWSFQITDQAGNTATKTVSLTLNSAAVTTAPTLVASSSFVNFNYSAGQQTPQPVSLNIFNQSSTQTANFSISVPNQPSWLNASYATGSLSLAPGQVMGLGVSVDPTKVASGAGSYTYNIALIGDFANSPLNILVTLNVVQGNAVNVLPNNVLPNVPNVPNGSVIRFIDSPTVYLVTNGQLLPFSTPEAFLAAGYAWSQVQVINQSSTPITASFYPYPSGSLVNDNGTIFFISGHTKVPFTSADVFIGLGYSFKNVIQGDLTNYALSAYLISTVSATHPWGSWLIYKGTVYYSTKDGLIGVPSSEVFMSNGGDWNFIVKANSFDIAALNANPNLPILTDNDPRTIH